jgi:putative oxidoreductase
MASVNYVAAIGRLMMSAIFLASSFEKLLKPTETQAFIGQHLPEPVALFWISTMVELIGGISLLIGLGTRFAALILAVFTVAAAVFFHTNFTDNNQFLHFMKDLAIAGGLLQVAAFGSGGLAVTHKRRGSVFR